MTNLDLLADQIERDIALLVFLEFSLKARIERAGKEHRARRHLWRARRLAKLAEFAEFAEFAELAA